MNLYSMIAPGMKHDFADQALERAFFVATNPTPGTGIASLAAATAFSATAGLMNIFNSATLQQGNVIRPVLLRLMCTTANTSAANYRLAMYLDSANRWSSGGSAITEVPVVDEGASGTSFVEPTSKATIYFGLLVLAAATDANLITHVNVAEDVMVANDVINIWFGCGPSGGLGGAMEQVDVVVPPVWIKPGANLSIHEFAASQSDDPEFEFEFWYIETPNQN